MTMGGFEQIYQDKASKKDDGNDGQHDQLVIMEGNNDISVSFEDSTSSTVSSSSSDLNLIEDDATSSTSSSFSSNGPLYELSELMAQLPIKRGLSKYYQGKSQTFASLACVESLEDLAKKGRPSCRRKMNSCKSYGGGLDNHSTYSPKATISKKSSRVSLLSSLGSRGALFSSCRHPIPCTEEPLM